MSRIISVCKSDNKGTSKTPVDKGVLKVGLGLEDDAHAGGDTKREISLLALESIAKMNVGDFQFKPGDFAENLTTIGIDLVSLPIGTRLQVGGKAILEITQIGKKCHTKCAIYQQVGKCIMPKEGVFARVITGGIVKPDDTIAVIED